MQKKPHQFAIKCQCTIFCNDIQVMSNKKTKYSILTLDSQQNIVSISQYNNLIQTNKTNNYKKIFNIIKLKSIHKKYLQEGKTTLEFQDEIVTVQGKKQIHSQLMINNASKENLSMFIDKLIKIRQKFIKSKQSINKIDSKYQSQTNQSKIRRKTCQNYKYQTTKISRKQMQMIAYNNKHRYRQIKKVIINKNTTNKLNLFSLSFELLDNIFIYCSFKLSYRLINKQFDKYILKNIFSLHLYDQIDNDTFNKLCKWVINIQCRMKNIHTLQLNNRYQDIELIKNRSKTLHFSTWKQINIINIVQLKCLNIYCLEIPYSINFDLSHLYEIKLVELRLKGKLVIVPNNKIKDQSIIKLLNVIQTIKCFEIIFINYNVIIMLHDPHKLIQLRIGVLNGIQQGIKQLNFKLYENLKILSIQYAFGITNKIIPSNLSLLLPFELIYFQIGSFINPKYLLQLPENIIHLKLIGSIYFNQHINQINLVKLKNLDISQCGNISPQAFQNLCNLNVITNWDRQNVKNANNFYSMRNLNFTTIK